MTCAPFPPGGSLETKKPLPCCGTLCSLLTQDIFSVPALIPPQPQACFRVKRFPFFTPQDTRKHFTDYYGRLFYTCSQVRVRASLVFPGGQRKPFLFLRALDFWAFGLSQTCHRNLFFFFFCRPLFDLATPSTMQRRFDGQPAFAPRLYLISAYRAFLISPADTGLGSDPRRSTQFLATLILLRKCAKNSGLSFS